MKTVNFTNEKSAEDFERNGSELSTAKVVHEDGSVELFFFDIPLNPEISVK